MTQLSPEELAQACATEMWNNDAASQSLGMRIDQIAPGTARLSMTIHKDMTNGQFICHGGYIFTLADSAFAYACNGYNQKAVAQHVAVTFITPAHAGDILSATATEIIHKERSGIYDVCVTNQNGERIAEFRGHSRTVKGTHLPEQ